VLESKIYKKIGFTLAEVLITLAIIGVVAALTIPSVVKKYKETQTIAQLKKAYSTLSQATSMVTAQYGSVENLNFKDGSASDMENIFLAYQPYLHIAKFCKNIAGCWTTKQTKALNGSDPGNTEAGLGGGIYTFVLNNGMKVNMDMWGDASAPDKFGVTTKTHALLIFTVDLNGDKDPNILGRDVFAFALTEKGMLPAGFANDSAHCRTTSTGWDCAAKVLKENAVKY
jgi:prepilin-type N-terminal cleavage/methylation domain-containing protein